MICVFSLPEAACAHVPLLLRRIDRNNILVYPPTFPVLDFSALVLIPTERDGGDMCVLFTRGSVILDGL